MTDDDPSAGAERPEPRELHCQCCGGYAGHGQVDPEYCSFCREAGEHKETGHVE